MSNHTPNTDLTLLRNANEQLVLALVQTQSLSEERLAYSTHVLSLLNEAVFATDADMKITAWNQAAEDMYGWHSAEVIGHHQTEFFLLEHGGPVGVSAHLFEAMFPRKDGEPLYVEGKILRLRGPDDEVIGYLNVHRDVSARKTFDAARELHIQQLQEAQERLLEVDRLKSQFLASMSHELRTPLNAIIGFSGLLLDGTLTPEQETQLRMVLKAGNRLLRVIDDILVAARLAAGKMPLELNWFHVGALLEQTLGSCRAEATRKGLQLGLEGDKKLQLYSDNSRIMQVVIHLLENAIKFTRQGNIVVAYRQLEGRLEITVADTGIGISIEHQKLIFEPFSQVETSLSRAYEGIGIGLYLSSKLAETLGGTIEVSSTKGKGSIFAITLPLVATEPASRPHPPTPAFPSDAPGRGL